MGSKRKDKHREKRSRSNSRTKIKKERHRSRSSSEDSYRHRHKRKKEKVRERVRSSSSKESFSSLKNLANKGFSSLKNLSSKGLSEINYNQAIENYDQEYFFRMSKRIQEEFKEEVDKELFAQNLYQQIDGKEVGLSFHKSVSICIQWLVENASGPDEIRKLTEKFSIRKYSLEFVNNQFSSHVIQSLIEASLKVLSRECTLEAYEQRHYKWSLNYILDVAEFIIDHIDEIMPDLNGFHVVTTVMEALGGIRVGRLHRNRKSMGFGQKTNINTEIEKDIVIKEVPSQLKLALKNLSKKIVNRDDNQLRELINGKTTTIIQYLLFILKLRLNDQCQQLVKKLIDLIFSNQDDKIAVISNANCVYLVEALILVSSEHRLKKIWEKHFKSNLRAMWTHDVANFIVQRLVDAVETEDLYQDISREILPHLASIFLLNRPGIGVCLAKATLKFTHFQQEFIYAIMKCFQCYEPKEKQVQLVTLMLFSNNTMITSPNNQLTNSHHQKAYNKGQNGQISLHGSLMLQYMFQYNDPYKLCKSLLAIDTRELLDICNDASGSHAIDAFLKSPTVSEKARLHLIDKLTGYFVELALNKYGSRVIDNILNNINIKVKERIMEEFSAKESLLQSNKNGYFLSKNIGLYHFKHRREQWRDIESQKDRKKKTFSELIDQGQDPYSNTQEPHQRYSVEKSYDKERSYDNNDNSLFNRQQYSLNNYHHSMASSYDQRSNSSHHSSFGANRKESSYLREREYDNGFNNNRYEDFKRPHPSFRHSPYNSYSNVKTKY